MEVTKVVAFDVDDVLFHSTKLLAEAYASQHGRAVEYPTITPDGRMRGLLNIFKEVTPHYTPDEIIERVEGILTKDDFHDFPPLRGAVATVERIVERNRAVAVSARPRVLTGITKDKINAHFPGMFESVHVIGERWGHGPGLDKATVFRELGVELVIDDVHGHVEQAKQVGAKALLFGDYPWNRVERLAEHVTRCEDWNAVNQYFDARR